MQRIRLLGSQRVPTAICNLLGLALHIKRLYNRAPRPTDSRAFALSFSPGPAAVCFMPGPLVEPPGIRQRPRRMNTLRNASPAERIVRAHPSGALVPGWNEAGRTRAGPRSEVTSYCSLGGY